jgi:hypothetical protein
MRTILFALVTFVTGCLTSAASADPTVELGDDNLALAAVMPSDPPDDVCLKLPDDDSACASACDPVKLVQFIPPGTCVAFVCHLTDGSVFRTGGCVPEQPVGAVRPSHAAL